jgi:multidrug transporter EmrE-like cation transporter
MVKSSFFVVFSIVVSVILNTIAQSFLKLGAGQNLLNFYILGGIFAYGLSTLFYILVLGKLNLSVAYPVAIGLTMIATTCSSAWLLKEQVSTIQWLGIGLMLAGISAIAFGKIS